MSLWYATFKINSVKRCCLCKRRIFFYWLSSHSSEVASCGLVSSTKSSPWHPPAVFLNTVCPSPHRTSLPPHSHLKPLHSPAHMFILPPSTWPYPPQPVLAGLLRHPFYPTLPLISVFSILPSPVLPRRDARRLDNLRFMEQRENNWSKKLPEREDMTFFKAFPCINDISFFQYQDEEGQC